MSWYLEPTRSLWLTLDQAVFWDLNNSLADSRAWQIFWAVANNRVTDILSALSMIGLFVHFTRRHRSNRLENTVAVFLLLAVVAVVGVQIGKAMDIGRLSPTVIHSDALRLSELVPWLPTKDISTDSFPGDHATVLLIFVGIVTFYLPRAYATVASVLAIVFMAPRVVGGAHWLTDDLVGSGAIAGFVLTCVLATPLHSIMLDRLERWVGTVRSHYEESAFGQ
jgi:membrane-associated phospholipid phosphatase